MQPENPGSQVRGMIEAMTDDDSPTLAETEVYVRPRKSGKRVTPVDPEVQRAIGRKHDRKRQARYTEFRKKTARAKTLSLARITNAEREAEALLNPYPEDVQRPLTRADCKGRQRPCPFVSCRHHLYVDVSGSSIKLNFLLDVDQIPATCSLDVADAGPAELERVGIIMNMTRERVRQIEGQALNKLAANRRALQLVKDATET